MDIPIPYLTVPADIVNQAIDSLGEPGKIIGDITDGTAVAETARRNYGQLLRQLLRSNHWPFARKQAQLTLLGDATGQSALPVSTFVETPWAYAYAWPIDAVQGRWMPWNPAAIQPLNAAGVPITTGASSALNYAMVPGRFLVSSSDQYPVEIGSAPWTQQPDLQRTEGVGPVSRKIILTDCSQAFFVYTRLVTVIEEWDDLFRQAMVALMAMTLTPVVVEEPKLRMAARAGMIAVARNALAEARVAASNEFGYPQTVDFEASFIQARNSGGWNALQAGLGASVGGIAGGYGCGYESFGYGGAVF